MPRKEESRMDQREYWDQVAEQKEFTTPFQLDAFSKYVERGATVLDVGCGYGRTLNFLRQNGYRQLAGIDFSAALIARGRRLFPELDLRVMTSATFDIPDASQDAVILLAVLTCIARDEDQAALVSEIERVLKPGGILYINDFLINTDERNQQRYKASPAGYPYGVFELPEGGLFRHQSEKHILCLCRAFHPLIWETCRYTTMNGHQSNGFCLIGRKEKMNG